MDGQLCFGIIFWYYDNLINQCNPVSLILFGFIQCFIFLVSKSHYMEMELEKESKETPKSLFYLKLFPN